MLELLKDLAYVLEKHNGGLTYTTADDGVHVTLGSNWSAASRVCIEWPSGGDVSRLREIIQANAEPVRAETNDPEETPTVCCKFCHKQTSETTAHLHDGGWVGDDCCWDERLRSSE